MPKRPRIVSTIIKSPTSNAMPPLWPGGRPAFTGLDFYMTAMRAELIHLARHAEAFGEGEDGGHGVAIIARAMGFLCHHADLMAEADRTDCRAFLDAQHYARPLHDAREIVRDAVGMDPVDFAREMSDRGAVYALNAAYQALPSFVFEFEYAPEPDAP